MNTALSIALMIILSPLAGHGSDVSVSDGSIYLRDRSGAFIALTQSRRDYDPVLLPDQSAVLYCRKKDNPRQNELWRVSVYSPRKEERLAFEPVEFHGSSCGGCQTPAVSPDGKFAYYLVDFSDTSGVLVKINVISRQRLVLTDAIGFEVVASGKYAGHLAVLKRKQTLTRTWNWYWLVDSDGKEVAPIGDESDLRIFKEQAQR